MSRDDAGISRRTLLRSLAAAGLAPAAIGVACDDDDVARSDALPSDADAGATADAAVPDAVEVGPAPLGFAHGVASGDPLSDGVMLWTRISLPAGEGEGPVTLGWEVGEAPALSTIVKSGEVATSAARDFTAKVDVRGLEPGRTYYYRFRHGELLSPTGRTRTAPVGATARVRFGVASCSSYAQGYFHGYRALARRLDLDAVIHLGDYIYEYGTGEYGTARPHEPATEALSLADYRTRHAQYKRDPDLQAAHRQHAFITVWDDHESANNAWKGGAENHQPASEGDWAARKAAAQKAYAEWMPIREQDDPARIWRKLSFGDLVDLVLLDTRLWGRSETSGGLLGPAPAEDPARTLLGDDQASWLEQQITGSTARWKLIGQQVMVANLLLSPGMIVNPDQWHGYPASRRRLLEFLRMRAAGDVVVLTGDIHSSWANELALNPLDAAEYDPATGAGAVAVELVTPAITSPGLPPAFFPFVEAARPSNPHLRWFDLVRRGFLIVDVTPERTQGAFFHFADVTQPAPVDESFAAAWSVAFGKTRLVQDAEAAPAAPAAAPAP